MYGNRKKKAKKTQICRIHSFDLDVKACVLHKFGRGETVVVTEDMPPSSLRNACLDQKDRQRPGPADLDLSSTLACEGPFYF